MTMFVDYIFDTAPDGTILMDKELKPSSVGVQDGDVFVVHITEENRIIFKKQKRENE